MPSIKKRVTGFIRQLSVPGTAPGHTAGAGAGTGGHGGGAAGTVGSKGAKKESSPLGKADCGVGFIQKYLSNG